ncbi:MAG: thiamine pyrophosphate-binding protein [Candidatus Latescibacterota bacterium]
MAKVNGNNLVAKALQRQGVDTFFFLMGGPMLGVEKACIDLGMRYVYARHEQAAATMAHAYARLLNRPGICMGCSGPGATNLITGVTSAWADCAPVVALAGASTWNGWGRGVFQEMEQLAMFKPITKWAERVYDTVRIPELISVALRQVKSGRPAPVYLEFPGDILYQEIEEEEVDFPDVARSRTDSRPYGDPDMVKAAVKMLSQAKRPLLMTGGGILWSGAAEQLRQFAEMAGIPFYTTPQGRGVIPDDHDLSFLAARSTAFREADCLLVVGTRFNYMVGHGQPPRFARDMRVIQVDIDQAEIGHNRAVDVGIVGDAAAVLGQLVKEGEGVLKPGLYSDWVERLRQVDKVKWAEQEKAMSTNRTPIHPLRLCKEIRDYLDRDAILCVDGQEILNYGRQSIPTFVPGHRLNSGPMGTMGVGLPFGLGAKVAKPDKQVLVLHGDGSFGLNAMELDTAVRSKLPVVTVISNNGGWTSDPVGEKPGRYLGNVRYDRMAEGLGCHGEFVERPEDIRPALERAFASGLPAVVNVVTDPAARATTQSFSGYHGPAA